MSTTSFWKCRQCGLVNFKADAACKRCGIAAAGPGVNPQSAGVVLPDGYVMPPPPGTGGVWQEAGTLVMHKNAYLPDRCVKCNAPANGQRLRRKLSWHHPLLYILVFGAALFYVILAMALSKRATVDFGICAEHRWRRRTLMWIGLALLGMGVVVPIVGFATDYVEVGVVGILLFLAALVWLIVVNRFVNVKRIDDQYVWLSGINNQYLMQFPPLPGPQQPMGPGFR